MSTRNRMYVAIDLKSFYASVECQERGLDPLKTNLVVADKSRTEKTICLAVTPSLKAYGIPGRARLFEVVAKVKDVNKQRLSKAPNHCFTEKSYDADTINNNPSCELDYLIAPPRMAKYMEYSTKIYQIYLKYIAPEDIHVYSVDEVFIDVTEYLNTYGMTPRELAQMLIKDVLLETGITATVGIGTNLYLAKIAMDIEAKHMTADENGVRIAELDEISYRKSLWNHRPLTDFWRVGSGIAKKLEQNGLFTMGDVARCSLGNENDFYNEELLFRLFGVNAEFLIDHAWGYEPVTIKEIKEYKPENNSLSTGQVLHCPYDYEKTRIIVKEMTDFLVLDLVDKRLVTDQIVLNIGYDIENLTDSKRKSNYDGEITIDRYGRKVPKHAHGTINLDKHTSSTKIIMEKTIELFERITDKELLVRRLNVVANHVIYEKDMKEPEVTFEQLDLFTNYEEKKEQEKKEKEELEKEKNLQLAMLSIKKKYGKNAILKGTNFEEGATSIERNAQIGGHKA